MNYKNINILVFPNSQYEESAKNVHYKGRRGENIVEENICIVMKVLQMHFC